MVNMNTSFYYVLPVVSIFFLQLQAMRVQKEIDCCSRHELPYREVVHNTDMIFDKKEGNLLWIWHGNRWQQSRNELGVPDNPFLIYGAILGINVIDNRKKKFHFSSKNYHSETLVMAQDEQNNLIRCAVGAFQVFDTTPTLKKTIFANWNAQLQDKLATITPDCHYLIAKKNGQQILEKRHIATGILKDHHFILPGIKCLQSVVSTNEKLLVVADNKAFELALKNGKLLKEFQFDKKIISAEYCLTNNGKAIGVENNIIKIYTEDNSLIKEINTIHKPMALKFSSCGNYIAAVTGQGLQSQPFRQNPILNAYIYDIRDGRIFCLKTDSTQGCSLAWSKTGLIACGTKKGDVMIYDLGFLKAQDERCADMVKIFMSALAKRKFCDVSIVTEH